MKGYAKVGWTGANRFGHIFSYDVKEGTEI
jgi:hypothetical protein